MRLKLNQSHIGRVASHGLLGWCLFFMALGILALAVASFGNSVRIREVWAQTQTLREEVKAMQDMPPKPRQSPPQEKPKN